MPPISFAQRIAPTTVVGSRGPENAVSGNIIPDIQEGLVRYVNSAAPYTALLNGKGDSIERRSSTNYQPQWMEKDVLPPFFELGATMNPGDTTITVATDHWKRMSAGYVFRHPTSKERIRVDTDPTTTSVVVRRSIGGTTAGTYAAGERFYLAGVAYEDGQDTPRAIHVIETLKYTNCQIFRTPLNLTGRSLNTDFYSGNDWENEKFEKKIEHMRAIEYAGFYGVRDSFSGSKHLITMTDGLESRIVSKVWGMNLADLSWALICDLAREALQWGKGGYWSGGQRLKYWFVPAVVLNKIAEVVHPQVFYDPGEEITLGVTVKYLLTPLGKLALVHTPMLDEISQMASGGTLADSFIVDLNHVMLRPHQGRDTRLLDNRQGNGLDAQIAEYFTDAGFQIELEDAHTKVEFTLT